ncbi:MAG TPA: hypothetical protein PLR28_09660 [Dokdonella sp.]|nr:hypothetical protein [Dokdonella sp.]
MSAIVRHPNRHVRAGSAALQALVRWHSEHSMLSLGLLRHRWPGYPLITGGSPKPEPAAWSTSPDDDGAGRACA